MTMMENGDPVLVTSHGPQMAGTVIHTGFLGADLRDYHWTQIITKKTGQALIMS
jgi:hypothetical protein